MIGKYTSEKNEHLIKVVHNSMLISQLSLYVLYIIWLRNKTQLFFYKLYQVLGAFQCLMTFFFFSSILADGLFSIPWKKVEKKIFLLSHHHICQPTFIFVPTSIFLSVEMNFTCTISPFNGTLGMLPMATKGQHSYRSLLSPAS